MKLNFCTTLQMCETGAKQVGMLLFDACGSEGDTSCVKDSEAMCQCEKRAGRMMCSELEYAW
jgi:hypothetical protein